MTKQLCIKVYRNLLQLVCEQPIVLQGINKLLYFIDFAYANKHDGKTLTMDEYYKMPYGPSPGELLDPLKSDIYNIINTKQYYEEIMMKVF